MASGSLERCESVVAAADDSEDFDDEFEAEETLFVEFLAVEVVVEEVPMELELDVAAGAFLEGWLDDDALEAEFAEFEEADDSDDVELDAGLDESAHAAPQSAAMAAPIPSATAKPPTRPMYAAALIISIPSTR